MARKTRKRFSSEFKREAVRLLEQGHKETAQLARELGVRRNQLYKWQNEIHAHGEGVILNLEGSGGNTRVQVNFEQAGSKWLVAEYANLETA